MLSTSILGAAPALGKPMVALVAAARLHGAVGLCKSLGGGVDAGKSVFMTFCCNRGVHPGGNWGIGARTATPGVCITTCSPGSAGLAGAIRVTPAQPCRSGSVVPDPPSRAHPTPGTWRLGMGQCELAWGHQRGTGASLPCPALQTGALLKMALSGVLLPRLKHGGELTGH